MLKKITSAVRRSLDRARTRHDLRMLLSLEDHVLRDIGVGRHEIHARLAGY
jgi:uncharacterized protein YjiS (DUF1127 family)